MKLLTAGVIALLGAGFLFFSPTSAEEPVKQAVNPILWTDVPDISIIRVGNAYYMSSTTMHMCPGVPIMKSTDLVNWKLISYAYETLADNDQLTLQNGKNAYSHGSWASSLRFHDGKFIVSTFSSTTGRTHIYTTTDPEKTPWTGTSFAPMLHDHSLFFDDDGKVYMITGGGRLRLVELNADLSGIKKGGVDQIIIENASKVAGSNIMLAAEGSQLFKVKGKYYLFNITWPRGGMRTQIVHRADKITGPWEGRICLQDQGVAQGGIVDTPDGKWWAYLFQDHGAVGRVPYLVPMTWEDGWPVIGVQGKAPMMIDLPANTDGLANIVTSDDFDRKPGEPALPLAWQWNHNPDNQNWSVTSRPGYLRLTTGRVDSDFTQARNSLTQRTFGPECSAEISLDVRQMKDGDFAGLGALQKSYGLVGVRQDGEAKFIVMNSVRGDTSAERERVPLNQETVWFRIDCDFKNKVDMAYFYYSLDGKSWTKIGEPLHMIYSLQHFMGYRFALFNYATQSAGGSADFDYFHLSPKLTQTNQ